MVGSAYGMWAFPWDPDTGSWNTSGYQFSPYGATCMSSSTEYMIAGHEGEDIVRIFQIVNGVPQERSVLSENTNDYANSVAISGEFALVGTYTYDGYAGLVYCYVKQASNDWVLFTTFQEAAPSGSQYFGSAVALGNNFGFVGMPYKDDSYSNAGAVMALALTPSCVALTSDIVNGTWDQPCSGVVHDGNCSFSCETGFHASPSSQTLTCEGAFESAGSGLWNTIAECPMNGFCPDPASHSN